MFCEHPRPHPERLVGSAAHKSAPCPLELAASYATAVAGALLAGGVRVDVGALKEALDAPRPRLSAKTSVLYLLPTAWKDRGRRLLAKVRHGAAAATWDADDVHAKEPLALGGGEPAAADGDPPPDGDGGAAAGGVLRIERDRLRALQNSDPDYMDIVAALTVSERG